MNQTDDELVALLNLGDRNAFQVIYKRYASDLFRYARKTIDVKEDCEEILQEIFTSLWERHESLRILSLKYYLLKAVQYKVVRYVQHRKTRMRYVEHYRFFEVAYDSIDKEERTPEAIMAMLVEFTNDLPNRCQTAIKLRLLENLSNGEIAQRMNITKKTVEVYMLTAYNHFRSSYGKIYKTT